MWYIWLILFLVVVKLYNKFMCGYCYSRTIMTGKIVIVTGANSGIGFETAFNMARRGAKVILACKDATKATEAATNIISRTGNKQVYYRHLDLTSLKSVRDFVEEFKMENVRLDVLVNNAGCIGYGTQKSADGIITEMQANHFGHFLLTILLVPFLKKSDNGRVVVVSSVLHKYGKVHFKTINKERTRQTYYNMFKVYSNSKLCNILFSNELARRLEGTRVTVNSLHPGHISTSIYKNINKIEEKLVNFILSTFFKSALEGAQTSIYLAIHEDVLDVTGNYYVDCKEGSMSETAKDSDLAAKLWDYSVEMVKLRPHEAV